MSEQLLAQPLTEEAPAKPRRGGRRKKRAELAGPLYLGHFGLREAPFGITPDTEFIYATRSHQEALNTLLVALKSGEGFVKVTGEVGTGKTLLCRRLLRTLEGSCVTAYLPNPGLLPETLLRNLADELALPVSELADPYDLLKSLNEALLGFAREGKPVVVVLDEAQAMPMESLETLRLLSNLETEKRKLLQLVLFGQPELDVRLSDPAIRQLKQRIAFHCRLGGMQREELHQYVTHRLRKAGLVAGELFADDALRALYSATGGVPRLVNIVANKCLFAVFGEGAQMVRARHVRAAARDTEGARRPWLWW